MDEHSDLFEIFSQAKARKFRAFFTPNHQLSLLIPNDLFYLQK
jgi:hypothetical protein